MTATVSRSFIRSTVGATPTLRPRSEALFTSVRAALAFAYSIEQFAIASSPNLMPPMGGSGRLSSLTAHEKHAQGALIRRSAEKRLRGMDLAVTFALYGFGRVRAAAIAQVARGETA